MSFNFTVKEFILGNGTGTPTFTFYRRGFNLGSSGSSPEWKDIILSGNTALTLVNAKANGLNYLKLFGGTEQRNLPKGHTQLEYVYMTSGSYIKIEDLLISAGYKIEYDFQTTTLGSSLRNFLGGRANGVSAGGGVRLSKLASGGTTLNRVVFYGFESGTEYYAPEQFQPNTRYKYTYNNGVCTLESGGSVVSTQTFTVTDNTSTKWGINTYVSNNDYWQTDSADGVYVYSLKVWNPQGELVMDLVPDLTSSNVVCFYDTVTGNIREATGGTFEAGTVTVPTPDTPIDIVCNNGVLRIQGSATGTVTQDGEPTPTEPIYPVFYQKGNLVLRAVNGYADTYNATTQTITRNIGMAVLDGTKRFSELSTPNCFRFGFGDRGIAGVNPICSHYPEATITLSVANMPDKTIKSHATAMNSFYLKDSRFSTEEELQAWLASQYNAGTPVTVYYVLETPVTESFTPNAYADGTVETVEVDTTGDTATAEMLLKVGDYQDVQSVLDGEVTRKIRVLVLTGDESWTRQTPPSGVTYYTYNLSIANYSGAGDLPNVPYCTHLQRATVTGRSNIPDNGIGVSANTPYSTLWLRCDTYESTTDWTNFLKAQYNAGTPVIIVYPLAKPTTESVTHQHLGIQAGSNVVEITQASIDNLELEVSYKGKEGE